MKNAFLAISILAVMNLTGQNKFYTKHGYINDSLVFVSVAEFVAIDSISDSNGRKIGYSEYSYSIMNIKTQKFIDSMSYVEILPYVHDISSCIYFILSYSGKGSIIGNPNQHILTIWSLTEKVPIGYRDKCKLFKYRRSKFQTYFYSERDNKFYLYTFKFKNKKVLIQRTQKKLS